MSLYKEVISGDTPSAQFEIPIYEFGPKGGKKIYLQAGMHADEHPGMLVLHHLIPMLESAEAEGILEAHFVILPVVNPLGLAHLSFHMHRGRYHPTNGLNYNRGWPDFAKRLIADTDFIADLSANGGGDKEVNKALVRARLAQYLQEMVPVTALDKQRQIVMSHCFDADMVLDLHCDDIALTHLFIIPQNLPRYQGLADRIGSLATLTAEDSGGGSFDEVWSGLWVSLAKALPDVAWPEPVLSVTVEYRGQGDVSDGLGYDDAQKLFDFFCDEGLVKAAPSAPRSAGAPPTDLAATQIVRVDKAGLIAYQVALGDRVEKGQVIAHLIALDGKAPIQERTAIIAETDGILFSMLQSKYVWPGTSIAKIAGTKRLESRAGYLLED